MKLAAAFLLSWFLVGAWAKLMRGLGLGKRVREDGPQSHLKKSGTPSMAGVPMALAAAAVGFAGDANLLLLGGLFLLIGLLDDLLPHLAGRSLLAREKLALQLAFAFLFAYLVRDELGYFAAPWLDLLFATFLVAGFANAMNFTDGVDGLAASVGALLLLPFLKDPLAAAAIGALLGFLWHNAPPARVFMGDAGSEALGALVAGFWLLEGGGLWLFLAGALPLIELVSVVVQVAYFRYTGGERLLLMSPLHHHLELIGWSEAKIVFRFAALTAVLVAAASALWGRL